MREGWEYKKLGEVASSELGKTLNKSKDTGKLYPYICAVNVLWDMIDLTILKHAFFEKEEIDRYSVRKGDLLVCEGGDTGRSAIWEKEEPVLYQNALHRVRFTTEMEARFAMYCLWHLKNNGQIDQKYSKGVTIKHLVKSSLLSIELPVPPLSTQQSIVSELDKINELIRLKKEQLKDYYNLAQSIFYEMFGDEKYERRKLKNIVKVKSGQVSPLEDPYCDMVHVGPANIESNTGRLINLKTAKEENLISGKYLFDSSMVLYSKIRPNLNKVTIADFEGICSADMYPLIPSKSIDKKFLLFILKQKEFLSYAIANSGRANIPKINREDLLEYSTILPPLSLQLQFAERLALIEKQKEQISSIIKDLETLLASRMQYWFD